MLSNLLTLAATTAVTATTTTVPAASNVSQAGPGALKTMAPSIDALLLDNAFNLVVAIVILIVGWTLAIWVRRGIRTAFTRVHVLDPSLRPVLASMAR